MEIEQFGTTDRAQIQSDSAGKFLAEEVYARPRDWQIPDTRPMPVEDQVHRSMHENMQKLTEQDQKVRETIDDALLTGNAQSVVDIIKEQSKANPAGLDRVMQAVADDFNKVSYMFNAGSALAYTRYDVQWKDGALSFRTSYGGCFPGSSLQQISADGVKQTRQSMFENHQ